MEASENKSLFDRREAILGDESLSPSQKIEQFVELARDAVSFLESGQSIRETSLHNFFATIKATVIEFEGDGVEF
ncbi:MAG: hypothetical protein KJ858_03465, partial [Nanoarchaeota archaeon]|nr:hypothetical protein [Nanoarchaeota archaeon]